MPARFGGGTKSARKSMITSEVVPCSHDLRCGDGGMSANCSAYDDRGGPRDSLQQSNADKTR